MHVDGPLCSLPFKRRDRPRRMGGSMEFQRGRMKGSLGPFIVCCGTGEPWRHVEARGA